ncbi:hypothetical protein T01_4399 [Trichinella spiralis]|uniref:Uncharacterized protein n=1 Tax=Trichinella spiralis TaxID=6334 RepID=A0A0V0YTD0_TRISP|nr:hypothetical protein T01_4399 [Trichinella spiralis]
MKLNKFTIQVNSLGSRRDLQRIAKLFYVKSKQFCVN